MAAKKFTRWIAGKYKEIFGVVTSSGAPNDGDIPALDTTGRLDISLMPVGVGAEVNVLPTSENLTAGDFVNIYDNGGVVTARKADSTTNAKPADGFVLLGVTSPANATVYRLSQTNTQLTGLTKGVDYYLSTTPGAISSTSPSGAGNISQRVGKAHSTTALVFDNTFYIELA